MPPLEVPRDLLSMPLLLCRQLAALDAWNKGRRRRERALMTEPMSREERLVADRRMAVLERAHAAVLARADAALDADPAPIASRPALRAVIAHRHLWLADKLSAALANQGVLVVASSGNGAETLGIVVAEQPDLLVAGDVLAMMSSAELLAEVERYAPFTARAVHVDDGAGVGSALEAGAQSVFVRQMQPEDVAMGLMLLLREQA